MYERWMIERHYVRPGVTGLWQISGRNDLAFDELVRMDLRYVHEWSATLDATILARTVGAVVSRRGAY
jgi:lipopolysaccharide/colanic/teichoic acid biosynthesis glycosyltransferase